ncbi:ScbR family autoregulator-binding transcription factor [Streptomyces sp. NPDC048275]|uniref:ScbR family autoregulator-binding transcription factor n=1 Tax=Streptomyces sp. NPDC048275 TaxID=3155629 RepID=UPI0033E71E16
MMVKQERAARTRQALIRAGAEVFAREGFVPASLAVISRRAGVSSGALHFHFESKRALAQAVEDEAVRAVRQTVRDASDRGGGALQAVVDATYGLMSRIDGDVVVRAGFELCGGLVHGRGPSLRQEWQRWIEDMLQRAGRDGWLAEGVSVDDAAATIVAATMGFEVLSGEDRAWLSQERVTGLWDLLLPRLAEQHALGSVSWGQGADSGGKGDDGGSRRAGGVWLADPHT